MPRPTKVASVVQEQKPRSPSSTSPVEGAVKQIRDTRVLIADRLKVDGKEVKLNRDEEKKHADSKKKG